MKIKLDENLPVELAEKLAALGHDARTVLSEGLRGEPDPVIWSAAQRERRFLITQDLDFSVWRGFPERHCGLLLVRLRNPSRQALVAKVEAAFESEFVESWYGRFVVVTNHKIRVRSAHRG